MKPTRKPSLQPVILPTSQPSLEPTRQLSSSSYPTATSSIPPLQPALQINYETGVTFTIAGDGQREVKDSNETSPASFKYPFGVTSDYFNGYLYITDKFGQCLRRINRKSAQVETITFQNGERE